MLGEEDACIVDPGNSIGHMLLHQTMTESVHSEVQIDQMLLLVPDRALADDLFNCYILSVQSLFPFLHILSFSTRYESIWRPEGSFFDGMEDKAIFHATLNITFALGGLVSHEVEKRNRNRFSDSFYQRARVLVPLDTIDTPSLEVVQLLLLTEYYLYTTKYAERCWVVIGIAMRLAQAIGLNCSPATPSVVTQYEAEMRSRTWHICLTMESYLSFPSSHTALTC